MVEDPVTGEKYLGVIEDSSGEKQIEVMDQSATGEKHVEVKEDSPVGEKHIEVMENTFTGSPKSSPPLDNPESSSMFGLTKHLAIEVTTSRGDIILLICCIISGLVDSTIYNAYGTFVSMQTVITFISCSPCVMSLLQFPRLRPWRLTGDSRATQSSWALVAPHPTQPANPMVGSNPSSPSQPSVSAASSSVSFPASSRPFAARQSRPLSSFKH